MGTDGPQATAAPPTEAIAHALRVLHPEGVFEVRALEVEGRGKPYRASGYFEDAEAAAQAAGAYEKRTPEGIYVTLNPPNPALLARSPNQITDYPKATTSDGDIVRRRWLLVDFDAKRPAHISATDDEVDASKRIANDCWMWLKELGWPEPVVAFSGNGYHALFRVELPNDDEARQLIQRVLEALHAGFTNDRVAVDTAVYNAARITKLYGTMTRKGADTPERPHRRSELRHVPDPLEVVPVELLEKVAEMAPKPEQPQQAPSNNGQFNHRLDVGRWLADRGYEFRTKQERGRTLYLLNRCPFDGSHGANSEIHVGQEVGGKLSAACKHASCQGRGWHQFKEAIGPPDGSHYDPPMGGNGRTDPRPTAPTHPNVEPEREADPEPRIRILRRHELADIPKPAFLLDEFLVCGSFAVLYSEPWLGKTFLAVSMALAVSHGIEWFGHDTIGGPVLYILAEGSGSLDARLRAWEEANENAQHGIHPGHSPGFFSIVSTVNLMVVGDVCAVLRQIDAVIDDAPRLIVVDTMARCMVGGDENSSRDMGAFIANVDVLRDRTGACVLALHHTGKDGLRERGSSSLRAAADTMLELTGNESLISVQVTKQRDSKAPPSKTLRKIPYGDSIILAESMDSIDGSGRKLLEALKTVQPTAWTSGVGTGELERASGLTRSLYYKVRKELAMKGFIHNVGEKNPAWRLTEKGEGVLAMDGQSTAVHSESMDAG